MFSLAQDLGVSEFQFIKLTFSGPLKRYARPVRTVASSCTLGSVFGWLVKVCA